MFTESEMTRLASVRARLLALKAQAECTKSGDGDVVVLISADGSYEITLFASFLFGHRSESWTQPTFAECLDCAETQLDYDETHKGYLRS